MTYEHNLLIVLLLFVIIAFVFSQGTRETFKNFCKISEITLADVDVYIINLDRNPERMLAFVKQYSASDMKFKQFQRISAVDGKSIDEWQMTTLLSERALKEVKDIESQGYRTKHYQLTRGAVGCYLSHMKVFEYISTSEAPYVFVFEDDVVIDKQLFSKSNKLISSIPNDWDVLLLACHCIVCDEFKEYQDVEQFFYTHAYIIKKESANKILKYLQSKPIEQQIDSELGAMVANGHVKIYAAKDWICRQSTAFKTEIQSPLKVVPGVDPYIIL